MNKLLFLALFPAFATAAPVINEFLAENQHSITDADGEHSDWIEIYNPDATPVNMSGWFLTDDAAAPQKWAFPGVTIQPGGFLMVFASGKNRMGAELHTNFSLNAAGEYLALRQPGGFGVSTEFAPAYPPQRGDVPFGRAHSRGGTDVLAGVTPSYLIPTAAAQLPSNWNAVSPVGGIWTPGSAPGGVGYDVSPPPTGTFNAARQQGAAAAQSSELGGYPASVGIDGSTSNFTHTVGTASDANPWWQVTFPTDAPLTNLQLFNRGDGCCPGRLRDITVQILDNANTVLWQSVVLNPNNSLVNPSTLTLDLVGLTGAPVSGRKVKVNRTGNPALGGGHDSYVLSLGEVIATAVSGGGPAPDGNIAPTGTSSQSSGGAFPSSNGTNNNFGDFTHTDGPDASARWSLDLNARKKINGITLHNRTSCCGSRMRDITVTVRDSDNTVVFESGLLNPENQGFAFPNGPGTLSLDFIALTGGPIIARHIEVRRTADADLSGTGGQGNADEANVLSLGEVVVSGNDFTSYVQLVPNDVKTPMYNVNPSAFIRYPFSITPGNNYTSMKMRVRYDDGFAAYLDGLKIAERNAPAGPVWNSTATGGERADLLAVRYEEIDLTAHLPLLTSGNHVFAIHGMTSAANDPDFLVQAQLNVTWENANAFTSYLDVSSPGSQNYSTWFEDFVGDTSFSVKRGFYSAPQELTITCETPSTQIYYTTNGATPSPLTGTLYSGPIPIAQTTVLRARAFRMNWRPSNTDTQTYLFLGDVLTQQPTGAPPLNWPASPVLNAAGQNQLLNYGMDQNVRNIYGDAQMLAALTQLPTLSIVTDQAKLTDPTTGIYTNAYGQGGDWERDASIEWLDPSKPEGQQGEFQHDFGLRIRGGYSRNPQYVKHSFRLYFRDSYSVGKLNYPIFGPSGTSEHDVIDLASSQNYSWAVGDGGFETMVRDPFARQTLLDAGSPGSRTKYVHLYLNGIYWGLYWFDERPSPGYGEAYFGGSKEDWDVLKTGNHSGGFATEATEGYMTQMPDGQGGMKDAPWRELWLKGRAFATAPGVNQNGNPDLAAYFAMLGRNADGTRNPALPVLVNVDSLIDYMLCIFYTGDGDAPLSSFLGNVRANNWFAIRSRANDLGFIFLNHDAEHTLGTSNSQNDRTGPFNSSDPTFNENNFAYSNPQWLFQDLAFSPEFRLRVADRAHRHFFNNGAMTATVAQARMDALSSKINLAVKAHAMRWGDVTKTPAYNAADWQSAVNVARGYLTNRTATVMTQLRSYELRTSFANASAPLYPTTNAPVFSQQGGTVAGTFNLTITATAGTIYYTTNGGDPRAIGGAAAGTQYTGPVPMAGPLTVVKARALSGGVWSALNEATFYTDTVDASAANIVISEVNYRPPAATPGDISAGFTDGDEFEFIELMNISSTGVRLTGCYFDRGITFTFPATVVPAGGRLVLARNSAAFAHRYGFAAAGEYAGGLSNDGETLRLATPGGALIKEFAYGIVAPWPAEANGNGTSLVLRRPGLNEPHGASASWRASVLITPGGGDSGAGYAAWKTANGVTSDTADDDGDGLPAFLEYGVGGSLTANNRGLLPSLEIVGNTIVLTVRHALGADDVTWLVESANNPASWAPEPLAVNPAQSSANGIETLTYVIPITPTSPHFFRVKYSAP